MILNFSNTTIINAAKNNRELWQRRRQINHQVQQTLQEDHASWKVKTPNKCFKGEQRQQQQNNRSMAIIDCWGCCCCRQWKTTLSDLATGAFPFSSPAFHHHHHVCAHLNVSFAYTPGIGRTISISSNSSTAKYNADRRLPEAEEVHYIQWQHIRRP